MAKRIDDIEMNIELEMCLEEEKKKSLKNIQNFYRKYGSIEIVKLQQYLNSLLDTITNQEEINEIKKQLDILEHYT